MTKFGIYAARLAVVVALWSCQNSPTPSPAGAQPNSVGSGRVTGMEAAIKLHPDSLPLYDRLLDTLAKRGEYAAAAGWCQKLLQRPNAPSYYLYVQADFYRMAQQQDSAIQAYRQFLKTDPQNEQVLLNLANTTAEAGYPVSLKLADSIANAFPDAELRSRCWFIKGVYYNMAKQYDSARYWLDKALTINHNFAEALMEKGYSFFDQDRYDDALRTFETLSQLNAKYADAFYWMAKCEEQLGRPEAAIAHYHKTLAIDISIHEARQALKRLQP
jgi:tetratricopeptide (TPR) repeat protein